MKIDTFKIAGVLLSLAGTIILAIRVTNILSELSLAVKAHDLNFQIRAARANGDKSIPPIQMVGSYVCIDNAEKLGTKLLILGFTLQIAGGACTVLSFVL